jgi:hypothetical protein
MAQPRKLRGPGSESEFIPRVPKGTKEIVLLPSVAHASPKAFGAATSVRRLPDSLFFYPRNSALKRWAITGLAKGL